MNRVYDLCQSNDYMNAMGLCLEAITEIKMAYNVLNHLSEHKDQMIGIWENK
jgi:hypothetical protein